MTDDTKALALELAALADAVWSLAMATGDDRAGLVAVDVEIGARLIAHGGALGDAPGVAASSPPPGPASSDGDSGQVGEGEWWLILDKDGDLVFSECAARADYQREVQDAQCPDLAPHSVVHLVPASRLAAAERQLEGACDLLSDNEQRMEAAERQRDDLSADLAKVMHENDTATARADALQRRVDAYHAVGKRASALLAAAKAAHTGYNPYSAAAIVSELAEVADVTQEGT